MLVLAGFRIKAGERVGVAGRTFRHQPGYRLLSHICLPDRDHLGHAAGSSLSCSVGPDRVSRRRPIRLIRAGQPMATVGVPARHMAAAGYDWPLPLAMTGHFGGFERSLPAKRWRRSAGRLGPCSKEQHLDGIG